MYNQLYDLLAIHNREGDTFDWNFDEGGGISKHLYEVNGRQTGGFLNAVSRAVLCGVVTVESLFGYSGLPASIVRSGHVYNIDPQSIHLYGKHDLSCWPFSGFQTTPDAGGNVFGVMVDGAPSAACIRASQAGIGNGDYPARISATYEP